jgi:hypothetical protein
MRQPTTKDLAEYFRLALEAGLCRENDIEAWADKMIADCKSDLPDWLLNLSIDGEASKNKLLDAVPGKSDPDTYWNLVFAHLGRAARANLLTEERIVRILFRWQLDRKIPKEHEGEVYGLDDGFDGIKEGWNSLEKFHQYFAEVFAQFREFENLIPQTDSKLSA